MGEGDDILWDDADAAERMATILLWGVGSNSLAVGVSVVSLSSPTLYATATAENPENGFIVMQFYSNIAYPGYPRG